MGQGNQTRALIIASKAQGWDPNEIGVGGWNRDPMDGFAGRGNMPDALGYFADVPDPQKGNPGPSDGTGEGMGDGTQVGPNGADGNRAPLGLTNPEPGKGKY